MHDMTFEEQIAKDAKKPASKDKLEFLRDQVRHILDLENRIENIETTLKDLKAEKRNLEHDTLPTLFMQNKVSALTLDADGNMPGYEAKLLDYYHANISVEWPATKQTKAFNWLTKHRAGDVVKNVFTIEVDRGNAKLAKKIESTLKKMKVPFGRRQTVPWKTLTAVIKEVYKSGKTLKDDELQTLGATVGKYISLKRQKEN